MFEIYILKQISCNKTIIAALQVKIKSEKLSEL